MKETKRNHNFNGWAFIAFPVAIVMFFTALPTLAGVVLSLFEWNGGGLPRFIGLRNYVDLFGSAQFYDALRNTLIFTATSVPITVIGAFLFAVALNAPWFAGRHFLRTVFFLPTIISIVAIGFIWRWVLEPSNAGLLNHLLSSICEFAGSIVGRPEWGAVDLPEWLGNNRWGLTTIIVVSIWRQLGFSIVLYLATLGNVPRSYYEAAAVDGASAWQSVWQITWPSVRPMTYFLLITSTIWALQVFDIVLVMIGSNQQEWTDVLNLYLYREFIHNRLGYAATVGVIVLVLTVVITIVQVMWLSRGERAVSRRGRAK